MQERTEILDYVIDWRSKTSTGFIGALLHITRNESGGSLSVPVGFIFGLIEPANEYSSAHWKIIITVREEIRYDVPSKSTSVFIKSAYANKLKYSIEKLMEKAQNIIRINPKLPEAARETLIKEGMCSSPITIQLIVGQYQYVYSNIEFNYE